ncbi:MAG: hypothetical protein SWZ49_13440 [Cyanobacteriota bacterium]|nr:hypothetical protein [Cyanobacteriota bacterium]
MGQITRLSIRIKILGDVALLRLYIGDRCFNKLISELRLRSPQVYSVFPGEKLQMTNYELQNLLTAMLESINN